MRIHAMSIDYGALGFFTEESQHTFHTTVGRAGHGVFTPRKLTSVLGARLDTPSHTIEVKSTADDLVTKTTQVLGTSSTDEHDRVVLEVVALSGDVGNGELSGRETDTSYLTNSRVGLTRLGSVDFCTDTLLLVAVLEKRDFALLLGRFAAPTSDYSQQSALSH